MNTQNNTPLLAAALATLLSAAAAHAQTIGQTALVPQLTGRYIAVGLDLPSPANFPPATFAEAYTDLATGGQTLRVSEATQTSDGDSVRVDGFDRGYAGETLIVEVEYDFAGAAPAPDEGVDGYRYAFETISAGNNFSNAVDGNRTFAGGRQTAATIGIGGELFTVEFRYDGQQLAGTRTLDAIGRPTADSARLDYDAQGRVRAYTLFNAEGQESSTFAYEDGRLASVTSTGPDAPDNFTITYSYTGNVVTGATVSGQARTSTLTRVDDGSDEDVVIIEEAVEGLGTYRTMYGLRAVSSATDGLPRTPVTLSSANPARPGAEVRLTGAVGGPLDVVLVDGAGRRLRVWRGDVRALELPADLPAGRYALVIGAPGYSPSTHALVVQ